MRRGLLRSAVAATCAVAALAAPPAAGAWSLETELLNFAKTTERGSGGAAARAAAGRRRAVNRGQRCRRKKGKARKRCIKRVGRRLGRPAATG